MFQDIIALTIVVLTLAYTIYKVYANIKPTGKSSKCAGCAGCSLKGVVKHLH